MADVAYNRFILHRLEVFAADDVLVSGRCADDISFHYGVCHALHLISIHCRLERANRINFGDDYAATGIAEGLRCPLTYIAITCNHCHFTGHHHIGCPTDCIHCRLTAAVLVVELRLGHRIIHIDRWHGQCACFHAVVQTQNAGSRLFRKSLDPVCELGKFIQHHVGQIASVVQNQIQRLAVCAKKQRLTNAPIELFLVHALPCVNGNSGSRNGRGGMILGRENVA